MESTFTIKCNNCKEEVVWKNGIDAYFQHISSRATTDESIIVECECCKNKIEVL